MAAVGPRESLSLQWRHDAALYRTRPYDLPTGVAFVYGRDDKTGLEVAYPNVSRKEGYGWNRRIYSDVLDEAGVPTVLLSCMTGPQFAAPRETALCKQTIRDDELGRVRSRVTYHENLLPHWRAISQGVQQYLREVSRPCRVQL